MFTGIMKKGHLWKYGNFVFQTGRLQVTKANLKIKILTWTMIRTRVSSSSLAHEFVWVVQLVECQRPEQESLV